jgi:hypothetical protein
MKYYRTFSLLMAITFAIVGIIFLFLADGVLEFFNSITTYTGMKLSPVKGVDFYLILAVGYMYLVSLLAYLMFKHPDNPNFPLLLTHAKLASSVLSLGFFILHQPYLIYVINFIVDGLIGLQVLYFYLNIKKRQP